MEFFKQMEITNYLLTQFHYM